MCLVLDRPNIRNIGGRGEAFLVMYPGVFGPRPRVGAGFGALRKAVVYKGQAGPAEQRTLLLQRLIGPLRVVGTLVTPAWVQPPTMGGHLRLEKKSGSGSGSLPKSYDVLLA